MSKNAIYAISAGALAVGGIAYYLATQKRDKAGFLAFIRGIAPEVRAKYGIEPEITITQASLESDFGQSGLAQGGNNLFGIKLSRAWIAQGKPSWSGRTQEFANNNGQKIAIDIRDNFKKYPNWRASVLDWADLIKGTYKTAYGFAQKGDLLAYGDAIFRTGYSTHPQYSTLLARTANEISALG